MRVLIVCDSASLRQGGEAQLPLRHFRALIDLGVDARLLAHSRSKSEIVALFPDLVDAISFVDETVVDRWMWKWGRHLPHAVHYATTGFVSRMSVQRRQRRLIRDMAVKGEIDIVHQPIPVSPCEPSALSDVGVPVVIGPMNGGMNYPPAFALGRGLLESIVRRVGRATAPMLNRLITGKRDASLLIVSNKRTFETLPFSQDLPVEVLCENGVDLDEWRPIDPLLSGDKKDVIPTFVFVGRLVKLKAVDILLEAFFRASLQTPMRLVIAGDGLERARLEEQAASLFGRKWIECPVRFTGHLSSSGCATLLRRADAMVFPSLNDCGGNVILEAMASGVPVIATAWGGALEYLTPACGILVPPDSRDALIEGFSEAMVRLAASRDLSIAMGAVGRARAKAVYGWSAKAKRMLSIYRVALARHGSFLSQAEFEVNPSWACHDDGRKDDTAVTPIPRRNKATLVAAEPA